MELKLKNVQKKHLALISELAKTLKIEVEQAVDDNSYNPDFVQKILKGDQDLKEGKGVKVDVKNLWK
ncbi:DUF2683 family protein [Mucilaginibacter sp.]